MVSSIFQLARVHGILLQLPISDFLFYDELEKLSAFKGLIWLGQTYPDNLPILGQHLYNII